MSEPRTRVRLKVLAALVVFMFAALTTRLWFLQVLAAPQFEQLANANQIRKVPIQPLRGEILDRSGVALATNTSTLAVFVDRQELGADKDGVIARLAALLQVSQTQIATALDSVKYLAYQPVPVATGVSKEAAFFIGEHQDEFPGVTFQPEPIRSYPYGSLAAHVVGYEYQITADELHAPQFASYSPGELIGQAGVEASYQSYLRGVPGTRDLQVDSTGRVIDPDYREVQPKAGDDVVLSIDAKAQHLAEQSLALGIATARRTPDPNTGIDFKAPAGAAIVMDPKTGQVLALASNPTFAPEMYVGGLSAENAAWLNDPANDQPLLDRAIAGQYPAGSTFKPFIAAAALKDHFASLKRSYHCPATYTSPGDTSGTIFTNWNSVDSGYMDLATALIQSCDTVFYPFGFDYYLHWIRTGGSNHGDQLLQQDLLGMGFGRRTGIDLPGEVTGVVPTVEYKARVNAQLKKIYGSRFTPQGWVPGDDILMSIGEGLVGVTPLQMAVGFSAIANGGNLMVPHVVLRVQTPDGHVVKSIGPQAYGKLPIPAKQVAYIRNALASVPVRGTANQAFAGFPLNEIPVAGKTGTAEIAGKQQTSWFAAMAPANDPKYVVVCMVEQAGHGAQTAAPIVRRILEGLFGLRTGNSITSGGIKD